MDIHTNSAYKFRRVTTPEVCPGALIGPAIWMITEIVGLDETIQGENRAEDLGTPTLKKPLERREEVD